ncbi:adenylate/guanylate cyclase domain-containing protein [Hansschlegelia sp.]|uniref:adenylate/guanylate cyclase domain-containing protein n=1 Tax=Hansschlegelia sp. TaxID=2041892 RepID=UPI002C736D9A|nr:adenylate/guanylate cyclase domain-containing protein [Hansschlegelia sp.]HVI27904.1 adenylate/guanylate cyclase domain-containing protein [Hansschlegelia sp.]
MIARAERAQRRLRAAAAAAIALLLGLLLASPWRAPLDAPAFDRLSTIAPPKPAADVVIVSIDEPSFAELRRQWPWPRDRHAELIKALRGAGAKVVALDIVFSEPSTEAADAALAQAAGPETVFAADRTVIDDANATQAITVEPLPELLANGADMGLATVSLDGDGVLRSAPMGEDAFAAVVAAKLGVTSSARAGDRLRFRGGPRTYATVSYYQALDPERFLPPGTLKEKIVFVGLSLHTAADAAAGGADAYATPFTARSSLLTAGVEVQATAFDAIRAGDLVRPAPLRAEWLALTLAGLAAASLARGGRVGWPAAAGAAALILAMFGASWLALDRAHLWLSPLPPALALALTIGASAALDYARERRARREITRAFGQYLAPELVERLASDPAALKLGGERRTLTILFCDVRGFTTLAERMKDDPERLTSLVNRLLGPLSEAVLAEGGTIDKYIGDCVMAFWNAPLDTPDHAERAVAAALGMLKAVDRLNGELAAEGAAGEAPLRLAIGVGVNTGDCVVGNLGSDRRFDYTAVGDAVNLASRLEGASKLYGVPLLIGAATATRVTRPLVELDRIAVKGKADGVAVFTALDGAAPAEQELFLAAYRAGRWNEAEAALASLQTHPTLAAYAARMGERLASVRRAPPAAGWTGVFAATEK